VLSDHGRHTPYRVALDRTLKASRLKRLEELIEAHAEREMKIMVDRGYGDIYAEFGSKFSALVEKEWLNLDEDDSAILRDTVYPFVQSWRTGDWDAVKRASDGFYEIARRVVAARRKTPLNPEEDPASSLILEHDHDGKPFTDENIV
jgi:cytochrome P450